MTARADEAERDGSAALGSGAELECLRRDPMYTRFLDTDPRRERAASHRSRTLRAGVVICSAASLAFGWLAASANPYGAGETIAVQPSVEWSVASPRTGGEPDPSGQAPAMEVGDDDNDPIGGAEDDLDSAPVAKRAPAPEVPEEVQPEAADEAARKQDERDRREAEVAAREEREAKRREEAEARKAAAAAKREEQARARQEAADARREAAAARKEAAAAKREEQAAAKRQAAEAAKAKREEQAAAKRQAAEAKREEQAAAKREAAEAAEAQREELAAAKREAAEAKRELEAAKREAAEAAEAQREELAASKRKAAEAAEAQRREAAAAEREAAEAAQAKREEMVAIKRGAGTLRINSRPWSQVFVDGSLVGTTPQMGIFLKPGAHEVRLFNPQFAMQKTFKVQLRAGESLTRSEDLEE